MRPLTVAALETAAVSVASWLVHLSPEAMSQYVFTSYNSLLSWSALQLLLAEDFRTEGAVGFDTQTVANLREALAQLYPGSTCELWREGSRQCVVVTVPGGELTSWPAQIPQPGA